VTTAIPPRGTLGAQRSQPPPAPLKDDHAGPAGAGGKTS